MKFQLVSINEAGEIVARFTEPMVDFAFAAQVQERMGGFDPNGHTLAIILVS